MVKPPHLGSHKLSGTGAEATLGLIDPEGRPGVKQTGPWMAAGATLRREEWMGVLARAPDGLLAAVWSATGREPGYTWVRSPEIGTVMVRGRQGATGGAFNLGEMTVTRCTLQLESGQVGHAYVPGRNGEKATIAALCDALMQDPDEAEDLRRQVIEPLIDAAEEAAEQRAAKAAATKVEFFTMARGEND